MPEYGFSLIHTLRIRTGIRFWLIPLYNKKSSSGCTFLNCLLKNQFCLMWYLHLFFLPFFLPFILFLQEITTCAKTPLDAWCRFNIDTTSFWRWNDVLWRKSVKFLYLKFFSKCEHGVSKVTGYYVLVPTYQRNI